MANCAFRRTLVSSSVATYNISLQGSGVYGITGTTVDPEGIIIVGSNPVRTKGYTAIGGETSITFTDTIGYSCLYVSRGGVDAQNILTTGTATGDDVKFVSATGVLTFGSFPENLCVRVSAAMIDSHAPENFENTSTVSAISL